MWKKQLSPVKSWNLPRLPIILNSLENHWWSIIETLALTPSVLLLLQLLLKWLIFIGSPHVHEADFEFKKMTWFAKLWQLRFWTLYCMLYRNESFETPWQIWQCCLANGMTVSLCFWWENVVFENTIQYSVWCSLMRIVLQMQPQVLICTQKYSNCYALENLAQVWKFSHTSWP